jgi:hypothetical protein
MENDEAGGIFVAEQDIDARLAQRRSRSGSSHSHREDSSGSSDHGKKSQASTEVTPLLSRDGSDEGGAGDPLNYEEPPLYTVWDGYRDFEGLPWYKQPSVRPAPFSSTCNCADVSRFIGSYPLLPSSL